MSQPLRGCITKTVHHTVIGTPLRNKKGWSSAVRDAVLERLLWQRTNTGLGVASRVVTVRGHPGLRPAARWRSGVCRYTSSGCPIPSCRTQVIHGRVAAIAPYDKELPEAPLMRSVRIGFVGSRGDRNTPPRWRDFLARPCSVVE